MSVTESVKNLRKFSAQWREGLSWTGEGLEPGSISKADFATVLDAAEASHTAVGDRLILMGLLADALAHRAEPAPQAVPVAARGVPPLGGLADRCAVGLRGGGGLRRFARATR